MRWTVILKVNNVDDCIKFVDSIKFYTHVLVYFQVEDSFKLVLDCVNDNNYGFLLGRLNDAQGRDNLKFQFDLYHDDGDDVYLVNYGQFILVRVVNDGKKVHVTPPDNVKKVKVSPPVNGIGTSSSSIVRVPLKVEDTPVDDEDSLVEKNIRTLFRNYTGTTTRSMNVTLSLYREILLDVIEQQQDRDVTIIKPLS